MVYLILRSWYPIFIYIYFCCCLLYLLDALQLFVGQLCLSHTQSHSQPLKLVLLEIETQVRGRNENVRLPVGWFVVAGELSHRGCSKFFFLFFSFKLSLLQPLREIRFYQQISNEKNTRIASNSKQIYFHENKPNSETVSSKKVV